MGPHAGGEGDIMTSQPPSNTELSGALRNQPSPPPWWYQPPTWWSQAPKRSLGRRMLRSLGIMIFILSIAFNVYLLALVSVAAGSSFGTQTLRMGKENQVVAVYTISGVIGDRSADDFEQFFREVSTAESIKALVLRVDSPGGGVSASDQIYARVKQLREKGKTVVVSMGGTAASGGYYVSAPANEIFAEPTTITGSIGVIAAWVNVSGTLDKLGLEPVVIRSSDAAAWKDEISPVRPMSDLQRKHMQSVLDQMQQRFNSIVKDGRGSRLKTKESTVSMTFYEGTPKQEVVNYKQIEPLNGKIYLAEEAKEFGLIDGIGYLNQAIDRAIELAKLDKPTVVEYAKRGWFFTAFFRNQEPALDVKAQMHRLQTPQIEMIWKVE